MKHNMGRTDRIVRSLVVAPLLVIVGVVVGPVTFWSLVMYALAAVMLATSSISFCPLYAPLRLSTARRESTGATR